MGVVRMHRLAGERVGSEQGHRENGGSRVHGAQVKQNRCAREPGDSWLRHLTAAPGRLLRHFAIVRSLPRHAAILQTSPTAKAHVDAMRFIPYKGRKK